MKREYIFKAKSSLNGEWKVGYLNHQLIAFEKFVPYICDFNGKYWELDEDTISQRVFSCKTNEYQLAEIFENDIVEVEFYSGTKYKYLIWFNRELEGLTILKFEDVRFDGYDYWSNTQNVAVDEFSLMLQEVYGDIKSVSIIGNTFDNQELLEFAREE
jgi:hypothetical protein